jgi:hypothetical protein
LFLLSFSAWEKQKRGGGWEEKIERGKEKWRTILLSYYNEKEEQEMKEKNRNYGEKMKEEERNKIEIRNIHIYI